MGLPIFSGEWSQGLGHRLGRFPSQGAGANETTPRGWAGGDKAAQPYRSGNRKKPGRSQQGPGGHGRKQTPGPRANAPLEGFQW